jgi:spore coat protein U-like protein
VSARIAAWCRAAVLAGALSPPSVGAVTCGVSTAGLAFGAYDVIAPAALTSTATIRLTCARQATDPVVVFAAAQFFVSRGIGNNYAQRQMANGAERMNYNLYTTNTYATVWGDGSGSTGIRTTSFLLTRGNPTQSRDVTGYGRVPALQDVAAGSYADSLVVSVNF